MRLALVFALFAASCTPRLAVTVRSPAAVRLGPVRAIAVLTHETRLGVVMRERVHHDLGRDSHFVLVRMCAERSCEPVDAFVRLYEREARVATMPAGNTMVATMLVAVETDVVSADTRPLVPKQDRTRSAALGGDAPQTVAERLVSEIAGEVARELFHPSQTEYLVFDDGAPFKLGIKQATEGRLADARRTFEEMIANNPRTAGAWFNLALVLEAQGDFAAARAHYEKATTLTSKAEYEQGLAAFERRVKRAQALSAPASR
ncbi:MAG: tetratricopeptide repeat protein [Myxococcus sp.]|nr:tetratricopeptide repeat protein [Myxococcus sp.]